MTKIKTTHVGSLPRPAEMMAKLHMLDDLPTEATQAGIKLLLDEGVLVEAP